MRARRRAPERVKSPGILGKNMKTLEIVLMIVVAIAGLAVGFFSNYPGMGVLDDIAYTLLYFAALYFVLTKKGGVSHKWTSLIASLLIPGLGQVIYAKQWIKMIIFSILILGGYIISEILYEINPLLALLIRLSVAIIAIYNLVDAYNIGKKAKPAETE